MSTCNDTLGNPSIETPQVTIFTKKKHKDLSHVAVIIIGAVGGLVLALLIISLSVFLYTRRKRTEVICTASKKELTLIFRHKIVALLKELILFH